MNFRRCQFRSSYDIHIIKSSFSLVSIKQSFWLKQSKCKTWMESVARQTDIWHLIFDSRCRKCGTLVQSSHYFSFLISFFVVFFLPILLIAFYSSYFISFHYEFKHFVSWLNLIKLNSIKPSSLHRTGMEGKCRNKIRLNR